IACAHYSTARPKKKSPGQMWLDAPGRMDYNESMISTNTEGMTMQSDIDIARAGQLKPVQAVATEAGIGEELLELYGRYKAKVDYLALKDRPMDGRLVLVTAINPTPAGEGKTTVSIGLADALRRAGKRTMLALREPSL